MVVAEGRNDKNGKLGGKGRVKIMGVMTNFYKQRHPPLPLPIFLGSGRAQRRMRRFVFQQLPAVNTVTFFI